MYGAVGTTQTCSAQAFFAQFSLSTVMYNASLAVYYVLVIVKKKKDSEIARIEPWLHANAIAWGLGTGIAGLGFTVSLFLFTFVMIFRLYDAEKSIFPRPSSSSTRLGGIAGSVHRHWDVKRHGHWRRVKLEHVKEEIMEGAWAHDVEKYLPLSFLLVVLTSETSICLFIYCSVYINGRFTTRLCGL